MADQPDNFFESLARQAARPQRGTATGRRLDEGDPRAYHGDHPDSQDYWYGPERKPKVGRGYQIVNPDEEEMTPDDFETGSYSTQDMKYGVQNRPKLGDMRGLLARRQKAAQIDAQIKALLAQKQALLGA